MNSIVQLQQDSGHLEMIVFEAGNLRCGLPIQEIQEIIEIPSITPVPMPQPEIEGLINLRGKIVTIINMRVRCGFPPKNYQKEMRIIATEAHGELMGLLVDKVEDSVKAPIEDIIGVPGNINGVGAEIFKAVYKKDNKLVGVLDLDSTLLGKPE